LNPHAFRHMILSWLDEKMSQYPRYGDQGRSSPVYVAVSLRHPLP